MGKFLLRQPSKDHALARTTRKKGGRRARSRGVLDGRTGNVVLLQSLRSLRGRHRHGRRLRLRTACACHTTKSRMFRRRHEAPVRNATTAMVLSTSYTNVFRRISFQARYGGKGLRNSAKCSTIAQANVKLINVPSGGMNDPQHHRAPQSHENQSGRRAVVPPANESPHKLLLAKKSLPRHRRPRYPYDRACSEDAIRLRRIRGMSGVFPERVAASNIQRSKGTFDQLPGRKKAPGCRRFPGRAGSPVGLVAAAANQKSTTANDVDVA